MNRIDCIATAKRATDGAHMCLWSKGPYQYEIEVFTGQISNWLYNFMCDYSEAKRMFEAMAEKGTCSLVVPYSY